MFKVLFISFLLVACSSKKTETRERKAGLYFRYGTSKLIKKDYPAALDYLKKAKELGREDADLYNNLGMAYFLLNDRHNAYQSFKKSLEYEPNKTDARLNLASYYFNQNAYIKAEKEYRRVLSDLTYRSHFRTYYNLGLIELKKNRFAQAKTYFRRSLKENPDYCSAYFQLGLLDFKQRNFTKAYQNFYSASKGTCYDEIAPHYQQALALIELGKKTQAIVKLKHIIDNHPQDNLTKTAERVLSQLNSGQLLTPSQEEIKDKYNRVNRSPSI